LRSKLAFQCLKIRYLLRWPLGLAARALLRRKLCDEVLVYSGFSVYKPGRQLYTDPHSEDSSSDVSLARGAIDLFRSKSRLLAKNERLIKSILLLEIPEPFSFKYVDSCCILNPSTALRHSKSVESARILLASHLTAAAAASLLFGGRFGYVGLRQVRVVMTIAQIRFLRRCLTKENHVYLLGWIFFLSEDLDGIRKHRHYVRLAQKRDLPRWCEG